MKRRIALAFCTASLFAAFPVLAQGRDGHGHGNGHGHPGNNSNHSGHDDDGNSAGHRRDAPHGFGDRDLVLANQANVASVAAAVATVNSALKSGSVTTPTGTVIPRSAQTETSGLLSNDANASAAIGAALSTAGVEASAIAPDLVKAFSSLSKEPQSLPSVLTQYNRFTNVALSQFISNPPPEFLALHAVLARLVAAAGTGK